jgi:predicted DNA-binding protein (UPF0251 family)/predicted Fe-Mo cluster-binding NifX family protein
MPRPCKRRRICAVPSCDRFGPRDGKEAARSIAMTLDEFQAIRAIDLDGLTQEQCAERMNVARTTAQAIYASARAKLAECLVNRAELVISGGEYELCGGEPRGCVSCKRNIAAGNREDGTMKLAVTYEDGQIFQHFGHTEQFKLYEVENGRVARTEVVDTNGSGHGALAGFLKEHGVDALLCGGIGGGAQQALQNAGIALYGGITGDADGAVDAFLSGSLRFDPDVHCDHHEHHGGDCGSHGCGGHSCG